MDGALFRAVDFDGTGRDGPRSTQEERFRHRLSDRDRSCIVARTRFLYRIGRRKWRRQVDAIGPVHHHKWCPQVGSFPGRGFHICAAPSSDPGVDPDTIGDEDHPVTITEGEPFTIRGFDYAGGWSVGDPMFGMTIDGLKVTNNRPKKDSAFVEVKFWRGTEVLASINCTSDDIAPGTTVTLNCITGDKKPTDYDRLTINDMF